MKDFRIGKTGEMLIGAALGTLLTISVDAAYKFATRYDKDGFGKDGYNKAGVDRDGYHRDGFNDLGFDRNGYDRDGFDKKGYNKEGFNRQGYDQQGFDRNGRDRRGFDRNGRNAAGYDRRGYDVEGYNKYGFAADGFNRTGLDCDGYNRHGYNAAGIDRDRKCKDFYEQRFEQLRFYLDKAFVQLKNEELAYALYEARRVLEEVLELFVKHYLGESRLGRTPEENINICLQKKLLGDDIAKSLHNARRQCNKDPHEIDARAALDYKTAWTVLLQVESFLEIAEFDLIYG